METPPESQRYIRLNRLMAHGNCGVHYRSYETDGFRAGLARAETKCVIAD